MMLKRGKILILFLIVTLLLPGILFSRSKSEDNKTLETLEIVFINDGHVAPYHLDWLKGFEDAILAYDRAFPDVKITGEWLSAEASLERMVEQAKEVIEQEPDIMFVNVIKPEPFEALIKEAQERGIIWIAVHSPMDSADYSFTLGDFENCYNIGLALGAYYRGSAKVALILGPEGNPTGELRREGFLSGLSEYQNIEVLAEGRADWDILQAQVVAEKWFVDYPDLDAIFGVTDAYLYLTIPNAQYRGNENITFWGYDGDIPILKQMQDGPVRADILLSGTREGWNFIQMAYRIHKGLPVEKLYNFYTPLVLQRETYEMILHNGFPSDIEVYIVEDAIEFAEHAYLEYGPDSVNKYYMNNETSK